MHLGEAQRDMRRAYVNGGVGIFVSGLIWAAAGLARIAKGAVRSRNLCIANAS